MRSYRQEFVKFLIDQKALLFGEFTLKSGRKSPYFFNAGQFNTSKSLAMLGKFYAAAIIESNLQFDLLFGPAYKGIPIVSSVAIALAEGYNQDLPFCFNRKERKSYGEGGQLVGALLEGRVLIVDDVVSSGTTLQESVDLISQYPADIVGIVTALDRQERGKGNLSAIQEIQTNYDIETINIIKLQDVIDYLSSLPGHEREVSAILSYQEKYGCK